MVKNNKEINSKKAVEGTLMKLFGFKRRIIEDDDYWLELKLKGKDFNVIIIVEDLDSITLLVGSKKGDDEIEVLETRYNFDKLKKLVNRYKALT